MPTLTYSLGHPTARRTLLSARGLKHGQAYIEQAHTSYTDLINARVTSENTIQRLIQLLNPDSKSSDKNQNHI